MYKLDIVALSTIAVRLDLKSLSAFCRTSKYHQRILHSQIFWKWKIIYDFGVSYSDDHSFDFKRKYFDLKPRLYSLTRKGARIIPGFSNVKTIVEGNDHTAMIIDEHHYGPCLYTFGNNTKGQLGLGYIKTRDDPSLVMGLKNVEAVSVGHCFTAVIADGPDGLPSLYTFGCNNSGQLGLNDIHNRYTPELVKGLKNVKAVTTGWMHTAVIADGPNGLPALYTFGGNKDGQLGLNDRYNRYKPTLVNIFKNLGKYQLKTINAGKKTTIVVIDELNTELETKNTENAENAENTENAENAELDTRLESKSSIYIVGCMYMSVGYNNDNNEFQISQDIVGELSSDYVEENYTDGLVLIEGLKNIKAVATSHFHTAIIADGPNNLPRLYTFGRNIYGELGLDDTNLRHIPTLVKDLNNVQAVSVSEFKSAAIADGPDGEAAVYIWGDWNNGFNSLKKPVLIPEFKYVRNIFNGNKILNVIAGAIR